jgi:hypothetical protein
MNSGDWVETLSALVEDFDGNWSLLYYDQQQHMPKTVKEKPVKVIKEDFKVVEKQVAFTGFFPDKHQRFL